MGRRRSGFKEAFDAVRANMRTFIAIPYNNEVQAREAVRNGKIQGAVIIPRAVFEDGVRKESSADRADCR